MKINDYELPKIEKTIKDFINDEDGNISRSKLVSIGAFVMLMTVMSSIDVFATHGSHSSHSSHASHSSTSYIRDHTSHGSHYDHGSHASHSSHTSHSNTSSHSNSIYSAEGDVDYGPRASNIKGVGDSPEFNQTSLDAGANARISSTDTFDMKLPNAPSIENLPETPTSGLSLRGNQVMNVVEKAAFIGGASAIMASGISAIKKAAEDRQEEEKAKEILNGNPGSVNSIDEIVEKLISEKSLEAEKLYVYNQNKGDIPFVLQSELNKAYRSIEALNAALDSNPEKAPSVDRFIEYFIPETIRLVLTYKQYVKDKAPQDDIDIILMKATESVHGLNEALQEKTHNIYQYSTMDAVAKADALNRILNQNGRDS